MRSDRPAHSTLCILSIASLIGGGLAFPAMARPRPDLPEPLLVAPAPAGDPGAMSAGSSPARSDTVDFGSYEIRPDGLKYAVLGETWTWDHGAADPLEGWTSADLTQNEADFWRQVTEASLAAEGNPAPWPLMNASLGIRPRTRGRSPTPNSAEASSRGNSGS